MEMNEAKLIILCYDQFPKLYDTFKPHHKHWQRVDLLLDYASSDQLEKLANRLGLPNFDDSSNIIGINGDGLNFFYIVRRLRENLYLTNIIKKALGIFAIIVLVGLFCIGTVIIWNNLSFEAKLVGMGVVVVVIILVILVILEISYSLSNAQPLKRGTGMTLEYIRGDFTANDIIAGQARKERHINKSENYGCYDTVAAWVIITIIFSLFFLVVVVVLAGLLGVILVISPNLPITLPQFTLFIGIMAIILLITNEALKRRMNKLRQPHD